MKSFSAVSIVVIAIMMMCAVAMPQAEAQERFGNEVIFNKAPSVEELQNLFGRPNKSAGTRKITLTQPAATAPAKPAAPAPNGGSVTVSHQPARHGAAPSDTKVSLRIQFALDSAEILPQFEGALVNLATFLQQNPDMRVEVGGHADTIGDAGHNLDLSTRRAESVKQYLIGVHGISPDRLIARGFGEAMPLQGIAGSDGRNRRVSFMQVQG